jgi:hypothetical protein
VAVNQVQMRCNGIGQLVEEYQSHDGPVGTSRTPAMNSKKFDKSPRTSFQSFLLGVSIWVSTQIPLCFSGCKSVECSTVRAGKDLIRGEIISSAGRKKLPIILTKAGGEELCILGPGTNVLRTGDLVVLKGDIVWTKPTKPVRIKNPDGSIEYTMPDVYGINEKPTKVFELTRIVSRAPAK